MGNYFRGFFEEYQHRMHFLQEELGFGEPIMYKSVLVAGLVYPQQDFALVFTYEVREEDVSVEFARVNPEELHRLNGDEYFMRLLEATKAYLEEILKELEILTLPPYEQRIRKKLYSQISTDPNIGELYRSLDRAERRFTKALYGKPPSDYHPMEKIRAQANLHAYLLHKYGEAVIRHVRYRFGLA